MQEVNKAAFGRLFTATNIAKAFFELIKATLAKLKEGAKAMKEFFEELWKALLKWLEELFGVPDLSQEAQRFFKNIDGVVFEIIPPNLLKKYVNDAIELCKSKGIKLEIEWIVEGHPEYYNSQLMGRLRVSTKDRKLLVLQLRPECAKITWQHEYWHLDDFLAMGYKKYATISKKTPWVHEEAVWLKTYAERHRWSEGELMVRTYTTAGTARKEMRNGLKTKILSH